MHKFTVKIIPFCIIIILIGITRFYTNYDARYNYYYYTNKNIKNKIILIGDSKSQSGIDENVFDKKEIANLSSWGARPYDNLISLEKYKIKNNVIFIVVTSRIFLQLDTTASLWNTKNKISGIYDFNLYAELKKQLNKSDEGSWEYKFQNGGSIKFVNQFRNYRPYNWSEDSSHYSKLLLDSQRQKYTDFKINHLIEIYNMLKNSNTIYFIDLPERKDFDGLVKSYENDLFKSLENKTGQSIIDFGTYNDEYFYDSHHLNKMGSKKFTTELVKFITSSKSNQTHQGSN